MAKTEKNILYTWDYNDSKSRGPMWYTIALSISIGLIIWGFFTGQYGMSIVIMLIIGFFYFLENNTEDEVKVSVTDLGINVQEGFYDFSRISNFSIIYSGNDAIFLRLNIAKRGLSILNLRVDNKIVSDIRPLLSNFIEENPKGELTLLEKISHSLKL